MTSYHAVMMGEDGMEFGADVVALNAGEASDMLADMYPESRVIQLEDPEQARAREAATYDLIRRGADFDEDGRPFFPHGDEDDEDEEDWEALGYDSEEDYLADNCLN